MESNRRRSSRRARKQRQNLMNAILVLGLVLVGLLAVLLFLPRDGTQDFPVKLHPELTMEAGSQLPDARKFLAENTQATVTYVDSSKVWVNVPGVYEVQLNCNGKVGAARIRVVDTTAPQGKLQDLMAYSTKLPEAGDFVLETQDVTEVTATYAKLPDNTIAGAQTVTIVLTDTSGNATTLQATLTLTVDNMAPVISGVADILIYQGDTVQYMKNVTATDDYDPVPNITVDRSQVDLNTPGKYTVIYTATDAAGNSSSASVTLTVMEKGDDFVALDVIYAEVDKILDEIITDGMSNQQKVEAIYWWIASNCRYDSHSVKDNWLQAGYRMLRDRKGDCFNYFGLCKLMLERQGFPNIDVEKIPNYEGDSHHYWSLVSIDGGKTYYHVDTTPRTVPVYFCLVTDKFMDDFSAQNHNCFNRDKSLYPPTPEVGP